MGKRDYNKEAHNQGQADAAKREYNNPYKTPFCGDNAEQKAAYDKGWNNGNNQG